jgi:hypothetical protein
LFHAILYNKHVFIDSFAKCDRKTLDAKDINGVWDAICLVFNNEEKQDIEGMDENLLAGDIHCQHFTPDDFAARHIATPAELKDKLKAIKLTIATMRTNRNKSGQGEADAEYIASLVKDFATEKGHDLEAMTEEVADELQALARRQVYATGSDMWAFCNGKAEVYYFWVLLEQHNLYQFIDMSVHKDERCSSDAPTPSASVKGGRLT